jgi:hypothetical protein
MPGAQPRRRRRRCLKLSSLPAAGSQSRARLAPASRKATRALIALPPARGGPERPVVVKLVVKLDLVVVKLVVKLDRLPERVGVQKDLW